LEKVLIILLIAVAAGFLGSLLGLGGRHHSNAGADAAAFGIDIKYAIGASNRLRHRHVPSGSAIAYLKDRLTNIRIAMYLEIGTTLGAITGAFLSAFINPKYLYIIFGLLMLYSGAHDAF
jgi:uncharacterized membrane protein YfcA